MIISASYKTDIPAFYGDWFLNRLNAGYCRIINPYGRQIYDVSLRKEQVDGFVFWTKNLGPFIDKLEIVKQQGYPFIIQYTVHAYPRALESSVIEAERSISYIKQIAENYGQRAIIWRYDPIIFTSITPTEFHIKNFTTLAQKLDGSVDEVVISFAQIYRKTLNNLTEASRIHGFTWGDPVDEIKYNLATELAEIAKDHNMQLTMCSQRRFLARGVKEARCIDARRLSDIANRPIHAKLKGNRPECGCYESIDIGEYDTCPFGCVYCYAVRNRRLAKTRYKEHDPNSEFLYKPKNIHLEMKEKKQDMSSNQATLFRF